MTIAIALDTEIINSLNLGPVQIVIDNLLTTGVIASCEQQLSFTIDYPQEPEDPRELPEIPEIRLWFIRLDSRYPWLPFLLDWKAGELARYTAMLVPHQFSASEGLQFNPEALEIFLMSKLFVLGDWLPQYNVNSTSRLKSMAQMLGYDLEDELFAMF
jgi:hypothetical protein